MYWRKSVALVAVAAAVGSLGLRAQCVGDSTSLGDSSYAIVVSADFARDMRPPTAPVDGTRLSWWYADNPDPGLIVDVGGCTARIWGGATAPSHWYGYWTGLTSSPFDVSRGFEVTALVAVEAVPHCFLLGVDLQLATGGAFAVHLDIGEALWALCHGRWREDGSLEWFECPVYRDVSTAGSHGPLVLRLVYDPAALVIRAYVGTSLLGASDIPGRPTFGTVALQVISRDPSNGPVECRVLGVTVGYGSK